MPKKPIVVLDSNEVILGLNANNPYSKVLIDNLNLLKEFYDFRISSQINQEILRNLPENTKDKFRKLINIGVLKLDDCEINKTLIKKYKNLGLKKGDIIIAAHAEEIKSKFLITENRHFLKKLKIRKFKIVNAEQFFIEVINLQ